MLTPHIDGAAAARRPPGRRVSTSSPPESTTSGSSPSAPTAGRSSTGGGSRTRREALIDLTRMMFTDQRWIDFVPVASSITTSSRIPAYNVAYWNLHARDVTLERRPLRSSTASRCGSFTSAASTPAAVSPEQAPGRSPARAAERAAGARADCAGTTAARLDSAPGSGRVRRHRTGGRTLPGGLPFDTTHAASLSGRPDRVRARDRASSRPIRSTRTDGADVSGLAQRRRWPSDAPGASHDTCTRSTGSARSAARVSQISTDAGGERFLRLGPPTMACSKRRFRRSCCPRAPDDPPPEVAASPAPTPGVNIAGYFRAELGIGEAARLLTHARRGRGHPACDHHLRGDLQPKVASVSRPRRRDVALRRQPRVREWGSDAAVRPKRGPASSSRAATRRATGSGSSSSFPPTMHGGFDFVDEVWCATDFVAAGRATSSAASPCSRSRCRCRFRPSAPRRGSRSALGLPDALHVSLHLRLLQHPRAEEPARADPGVQPRVRAR